MAKNCNSNSNNPKSNGTLTHHVAVFAFPFGTHATPLLNITRRLASIAAESNTNVQFSFFSTSQPLKLLFPQEPKRNGQFPNIRAYEIWDGKPQGYVSNNKDRFEEVDLFLGAAVVPGFLRAAVAAAEAEVGVEVGCVIGDAFLWFLGDLGVEIGVPWVPCFTSEEHGLSIHVYTDLIRQKFGTHGIEGIEEETLDFIPGLSKIRVKDIQDGVINGNLNSPIARTVHQMGRVLPRATAVCISSCEEFDPVVTRDLRSKFSKLLTLGPFNLAMPPPKTPDTYDCLPWLDKQLPKSVVYVSFGSYVAPPPPELVALAEGLEASNVNFLWSLKDHLKVHLPNGFLERNKDKGMVVPWVPQTEVLAHEAVGVFITHFGFNSIAESLVAEVPMIGRPFFGDQPLNARLVEAVWEIGLRVEDRVLTREGVKNSLARVLSSDEGLKMRGNLRNLKELLVKAVAPGGSSNRNFRLLFDLITKA